MYIEIVIGGRSEGLEEVVREWEGKFDVGVHKWEWKEMREEENKSRIHFLYVGEGIEEVRKKGLVGMDIVVIED